MNLWGSLLWEWFGWDGIAAMAFWGCVAAVLVPPPVVATILNLDWSAIGVIASVIGSALLIAFKLGQGNSKLDALADSDEEMQREFTAMRNEMVAMRREMTDDRREQRKRNRAMWRKIDAIESELTAIRERVGKMEATLTREDAA